MITDVKIKDRDQDTEMLRMALNLAQLPVNYAQVDLIVKITEVFNKKKGEFDLSDGVNIYHKWKEQWDAYFEEVNKTEEHD